MADQHDEAGDAILRAAFARSSIGLGVLGDDGGWQEVNAALCRMTGRGAGDLVGVEATSLLHPDDRAAFEASVDALFAGDAATDDLEVRVVRPDGSATWLAVSATAVVAPDSPGCVFCQVRDISARRHAEERLRRELEERHALEAQLAQSQKMEAVGRLAGGIAHDFNNLLTAILGYTEMALDELPAGDRLRRDLEQVHAAGSRAADLVRQLLAFSRRRVLERVAIDLNEVVVGLEPILGRLLGAHLDLRIETDPMCGRVHAGDRSQLEQVVVNLAINARDAMPDGGRLTITTRGDAVLAEHGDGEEDAAGPYVLLVVSDTGTGMDDEVLERCFEPFFTTKPAGEGTGLGLSTVYGIVNQAGGAIRVRTAPGEGTTFLIYLPMAAGTGGEEVDAELDAATRGTETVLLVEDEAPVRELATRTLERQGYRVLTAGDGAHALEVAAAHDGPIHLLVSDVVMPEIGGPELARRLAEDRPDLVVLYISGYTPDGALSAAPGRGADFLQKPFTARQLATAARRVLDHLAPR